MLQILTSYPDIFRLPQSLSPTKSRSSHRFPRSTKYSYKKLSEESDYSTELQSSVPPSISNSKFALLATLQLSIRTSGTEFSCINSSPAQSPTSPRSSFCSFENNPPSLRQQGRLALTFAIRKYSEVSNEERIALANEIEEELDRLYEGSQYRENIYFVGGLLAEEATGEDVVLKLLRRETSIEDILVWGVKSDDWENQMLI